MNRRPEEPIDTGLLEFYEHLLACVKLPAVRNGTWSLLTSTAAWEGNWTAECFICFYWTNSEEEKLMVVVNFAPHQSQCYLHLPFGDLPGRAVGLEDLMGHHTYERDGTDVYERGLYLDIPAWGYHVFRVKTCSKD